jgi:monoamine oxidase
LREYFIFGKHYANMAVNGINEMNGVAMRDHASTTHGKAARPLNIAIVGAGIGGLAAAVGLRRNGHSVAVG